MSLYFWEIKKTLRRRTSAVALGLALVLAFGTALLIGILDLDHSTWSSAGGRDEHIDVPAWQEVKNQIEWTKPWQGLLTEEKLIAAQEIYRKAVDDPANSDEHGLLYLDAWETQVREPLGAMLDLLGNSAYKLYSAEQSAIEPAKYGEFYACRQALLEQDLAEQYKDEADRQFFLAMNAGVETPFAFGWYNGTYLFVALFDDTCQFIGMLLCIAMAPLFAGEVQTSAAVLLAARHGRGRLARAKLAAALTVTAVVYLLCAGLYLAVQVAFVGTGGWALPIQLSDLLAPAAMTYAQAQIYDMALGLAHCLAAVAVTALASAMTGSPFAAMAAAAGVLVGLPALSNWLPAVAGQVLAFLPFVTHYNELIHTNLLRLFGVRVWMPWARLAAQPLITLAVLPLAARGWTKRQVS